jgi:predicted dehydrogenase
VLLGPVSSVYAELDRRRPGASVDDDTFVALAHTSGARSHLWMSVAAAQLGPRFRVLGSTAAWTSWGLDQQEPQLRSGMLPGDDGFGSVPPDRWGRLGADDAQTVPTLDGAYAEFWRGVVAAVSEGAPPPVDPEDSVAVLEVIAAALRSAEDGSVVHFASE